MTNNAVDGVLGDSTSLTIAPTASTEETDYTLRVRVRESDYGVAAVDTDLTITVVNCSTKSFENLNTAPVEMTVGNPTEIWQTYVLEENDSGVSYSSLCGYATQTWSNLPEFCNSAN